MFLKKIMLVLLAMLGGWQTCYAQYCPTGAVNPPIDPDDPVVVLFGDSITVGENINSNSSSGNGRSACFDSNAPTIETHNLLNLNNRPTYVINWGYSGSTSGAGPINSHNNGLSRINANLWQTRNNHPTASQLIVLILYGTNDFGSGIDQQATANNIGLLIDRARQVGYTPVIGTLTPRSDRNSGFMQDLNGRIRSVAHGRGATVVDIYQHFINYGNWQGLMDFECYSSRCLYLHPNNTGYRYIAQKWYSSYLESHIPLVAPPLAPPPVISPMLQLLLLDDD